MTPSKVSMEKAREIIKKSRLKKGQSAKVEDWASFNILKLSETIASLLDTQRKEVVEEIADKVLMSTLNKMVLAKEIREMK